jgi:Plasmid encoded RepA protein
MADQDDEKQRALALSLPVSEAKPARRVRPISRPQLRLIEASADIRINPEPQELAFLSKLFIQATLPHRNPGNSLPLWTRTNGNLTLTVQPAQERGKLLGYPYGTIPRLLLFWMTTEALRTQASRLELGHSLTTFMRELGLNPDNGSTGAKRSDARRLRDQMKRLFFSTISFETSVANAQHTRDTWLRMVVAPKGMLWWDHREPDQSTLWGSWIELNPDFYKAIISTPVPVDMRALQALKRSPLQLDLYAWATYTAYVVSKSRETRFIAWRWLHEQFGADYTDLKDFKRHAKEAMTRVASVYPALVTRPRDGGFDVLPSSLPAVLEQPK